MGAVREARRRCVPITVLAACLLTTGCATRDAVEVSAPPSPRESRSEAVQPSLEATIPNDGSVVDHEPLSTPTHPLACPAGKTPFLDIERFPGDGADGAETPIMAVATGYGVERSTLDARPMAPFDGAPVWVTAPHDETFIVTGLPDGSWFAARASFKGCTGPGASDQPQ